MDTFEPISVWTWIKIAALVIFYALRAGVFWLRYLRHRPICFGDTLSLSHHVTIEIGPRGRIKVVRMLTPVSEFAA